MPWMIHPERGKMFFHPIDVRDAVKDGWNELDVTPPAPAAPAPLPPAPVGATIAGGTPPKEVAPKAPSLPGQPRTNNKVGKAAVPPEVEKVAAPKVEAPKSE